mmetsp:Transcript_17286/g.37350  ORF Transcript_17286/g.37350 Transcript_17286/m.37350 type:complete len:207 (+) Transcript_17286:3545-4165(+)
MFREHRVVVTRTTLAVLKGVHFYQVFEALERLERSVGLLAVARAQMLHEAVLGLKHLGLDAGAYASTLRTNIVHLPCEHADEMFHLLGERQLIGLARERPVLLWVVRTLQKLERLIKLLTDRVCCVLRALLVRCQLLEHGGGSWKAYWRRRRIGESLRTADGVLKLADKLEDGLLAWNSLPLLQLLQRHAHGNKVRRARRRRQRSL